MANVEPNALVAWEPQDETKKREGKRPAAGVPARDDGPVQLDEALHREKLAASEARFRELVESSLDWVWEVDGFGKVTYSSPQISSLLGLDVGEVVGQPLSMFLPEVWMQVSQKANPSVDAITDVFSTARHKSGNLVVFDTSCVAGRGAEPTWRGVSRDVSERVHASERLKRSEEGLALAQEIAKLGHWELDLQGRENVWSTQMFRMLNVAEGTPPSLEEFLTIVHPEDRARVRAQVEQAAVLGHATRYEWRSDPERGEPRVFEARSLPVRSAAGVPQKLVGTLLDITDKRQAELARRESDLRFKVYVDAAPDAIFVIDAAGVLVEANQAGAEITGCAKPELIGLPLSGFIATEDRERYLAGLSALRVAGCASGEFRVRRVDGEERLAHVEAVRLSSARALVFAKDVTAHKEAQEALRQARESLHHAEKMQAIGQLAGGVAHDFNNQLTTVLAFTELLRGQLESNGTLTAYCDQVIGGIKRASDLTAQLLAYSRKGKYQSVRIDLDELVAEVSTLLRRTIDRKVDVRLELGAAACSTIGDPTQLQNALLNLALNARDAMSDGGRLTIATRVVDGGTIAPHGELGALTGDRYVEVAVADTGVGMEADVLARIFEPFFSTKAPGRGIGMGLPSVYGAIAAHHGAIRVESVPQQGSTFFVYLPVVEFQPATELQVASNAVVAKRARIMVVEDEEPLRAAVCTALTQLGHGVSAFANGREAIDHYAVHWRETDLVILDMIMPVMNGKETFAALRAINPDVIALLASGYSWEGEVEEVLGSGVKGFLRKPFKMDDLAKGVTDAFAGNFRPSRSPMLP